MLKINQRTNNNKSTYSDLLNSEEFTLRINVDIINKDIDRLNKLLTSSVLRENTLNIKTIIKYLKKLKNKLDENNNLEMCWQIKNNELYSYSVNLHDFSEYGVDVKDYIELKDNKLIILDTSKIIDILAFEVIYKDFGYTHMDLEDLLEHTGITSFTDSKVLTDFFIEEEIEPYKVGKLAKIDKSPYLSILDNKLYDYFGKEFGKLRDNEFYRELLTHNSKCVNSLIANEIYQYSNKNKLNWKLVMVSDSSIALLIDEKDKFSVDTVLYDASIRCFGRYFRIKPKITIY